MHAVLKKLAGSAEIERASILNSDVFYTYAFVVSYFIS